MSVLSTSIYLSIKSGCLSRDITHVELLSLVERYRVGVRSVGYSTDSSTLLPHPPSLNEANEDYVEVLQRVIVLAAEE